ncbi:hypothetical protein L208DRAFT_1415881 [Tricholoma matsutake]|nr:hypothetical protein L208DRAFT_1415881 [Tricholoma matsutake 945]
MYRWRSAPFTAVEGTDQQAKSFNSQRAYMHSLGGLGCLGVFRTKMMGMGTQACMVHGGIKISKSRASTASLAQKHAAEFGFLNVLEANDPSAPIVACTHLDATIDADGRRYSTFKAFLLEELAKSRQNLMICTGVFVTSHITFRLE